MCCYDCGEIDPVYTYIDHQINIIHAYAAWGPPASVTVNFGPQQPLLTLEKANEIEQKVVKGCIWGNTDVYPDAIDWTSTPFGVLILMNLKGRGIDIKIVENGNAMGGKNGPGGRVVMTDHVFEAGPDGTLEYTDNQFVTIEMNRASVADAAAKMGVSKEEAYAETVIHELRHVVSGEAPTHPPGTFPGEAAYEESDFVEAANADYSDVFEGDPAPRIYWYEHNKTPDPANTVAACIAWILDHNQQKADNFHNTVDSARSASYQVPTYLMDWSSLPAGS